MSSHRGKNVTLFEASLTHSGDTVPSATIWKALNLDHATSQEVDSNPNMSSDYTENCWVRLFAHIHYAGCMI